MLLLDIDNSLEVVVFKLSPIRIHSNQFLILWRAPMLLLQIIICIMKSIVLIICILLVLL